MILTFIITASCGRCNIIENLKRISKADCENIEVLCLGGFEEDIAHLCKNVVVYNPAIQNNIELCNFAIKKCKGDYIVFINSLDLINVDGVRKLYSYLSSNVRNDKEKNKQYKITYIDKMACESFYGKVFELDIIKDNCLKLTGPRVYHDFAFMVKYCYFSPCIKNCKPFLFDVARHDENIDGYISWGIDEPINIINGLCDFFENVCDENNNYSEWVILKIFWIYFPYFNKKQRLSFLKKVRSVVICFSVKSNDWVIDSILHKRYFDILDGNYKDRIFNYYNFMGIGFRIPRKKLCNFIFDRDEKYAQNNPFLNLLGVKNRFARNYINVNKSHYGDYFEFKVSKNFPILGRAFIRNPFKKSILIIGYLGASNFGDECMLKITLSKINFDLYDVSIVLPVKNFNYNFSSFSNVNFYYPPDNISDLEKAANFFDELLICGGAHIDDTESNSLSYVPYLALELSLLMLEMKKKVIWDAVSSNSTLSDNQYISKLKFVAENSCFSLRDPYSISVLKNAGINVDNMRLVKDIVFSLELNYKILTVTLLEFENFETLLDYVRDIIKFVKNSSDYYKICFLPFFNLNHSDLRLIDRIIDSVDFMGVDYFIAPEYNDVDSMMMLLKSSNIFVNMRYHASLLSLRLGKPNLSIVTNNHLHYFNKLIYLHEMFCDKNYIISSNYKFGDIGSLLTSLTLG